MLHDALARGRVTAGGINFPVPGGMLETAENLRREYAIPREEQDEFAVRSHQRAAAARDEGRFADEIVPVTVTGPEGRHRRRHRRAHPRPTRRWRSSPGCGPILGRDDPDATVTAGNASGPERRRRDLRRHAPGEGRGAGAAAAGPARVVGRRRGAAGHDGHRPGAGGGEGARRRRGSTLADIDLIELNEAFAAQVLACTREWKLAPDDFDRLNVNGSGISLGHPVGATGGRILATLTREMAPPRRPVRPRDDVHRRRPGPRRRVSNGWRLPDRHATAGWR